MTVDPFEFYLKNPEALKKAVLERRACMERGLRELASIESDTQVNVSAAGDVEIINPYKSGKYGKQKTWWKR